MSETKLTSTGHALADTPLLDNHFQSARAEYEDCLRSVGIKPGWTVLDAGCGGGNFLPLMSELVGPQGCVIAMDVAPENVARVEALCTEGIYPPIQTRIGSVLSLPFEDATIDCVWCANVAQYLTEPELDQAIAEFARLIAARRSASNALGSWSGTSMPSRLRNAGLTAVSRKGWLVMAPYTRALFSDVLVYYAGLAAKLDVPASEFGPGKKRRTTLTNFLKIPIAALGSFSC
jgi:arsenite methyltransferase